MKITANTTLASHRRARAYQLRKLHGLTFKEIGLRLDVCAAYARQLYVREERRQRREPHWTDGLGVRAANGLNNASINSRGKALEAYQSGRLRPGHFPRNYGWKCHTEVAEWLGLPAPQKVCKHCGQGI